MYRLGVATVAKGTENGIKHSTKRNPVARAHGFRKFTTTNMIRSKVNFEEREMLLGHPIGLKKAYYRSDEDELLQEYLKTVALLTINEEHRLKRVYWRVPNLMPLQVQRNRNAR